MVERPQLQLISFVNREHMMRRKQEETEWALAAIRHSDVLTRMHGSAVPLPHCPNYNLTVREFQTSGHFRKSLAGPKKTYDLTTITNAQASGPIAAAVTYFTTNEGCLRMVARRTNDIQAVVDARTYAFASATEDAVGTYLQELMQLDRYRIQEPADIIGCDACDIGIGVPITLHEQKINTVRKLVTIMGNSIR